MTDTTQTEATPAFNVEQHPATEWSNLTTMGWIILVIGLGVASWGLAYDPSVTVPGVDRDFGYGITIPGLPSEVVNIGEAAKKIMIFTAGVGLTLMGTILAVAGRIIDRVARIGRLIHNRVPA